MLPAGRYAASMQCPLSELLVFGAENAIGATVIGFGGEGYILIERGTPIAAYFDDNLHHLTGLAALNFIMEKPFLECDVRLYMPDEMIDIVDFAQDRGWLVEEEVLHREKRISEALVDEDKLMAILRQRGVLVVSALYEGFPVQSVGTGDFEYEAAIAEDLLRAGRKVAGELGIGSLDQLTLETPEGKLIIAPYGELSLFVHTTPDAHLGLIRLAIKSILEAEGRVDFLSDIESMI